MPAATALDWRDSTDFAQAPTPADLREFFGIPPSPPEDLTANIREKRKYWKKKQSKARSDEALKYSAAVLQAIADAEDALIRGAAASGDAGAQPGDAGFRPGAGGREPSTVEDVWRELERLLFRSRYTEALDWVQRYEERWGQYPDFIDMRSAVILEAVQNVPGSSLDPGTVESAVTGSRWAIDNIGPTEARYLTLAELLEAVGRPAEIPAVFDDAARRLPGMSASFQVRVLSIQFANEAWLPLLRRCVDLVGQAGDDRALRSELVQMIIGRAVAELLPLDSEDAVHRYQTIVATAAWIAEGVPEAEEFVRMHRMWAANADQPVFGGNWQWRAFFGLITLFLALPLVNSSRSKPAWQILLDGPALGNVKQRKGAVKSQNQSWFLVTRNSYIAPVHEKARLPWQQQADQWPEIDISTLFNF